MARAVTFTGEEKQEVGSLGDPSSAAVLPKLITRPCSRFQVWREAENEAEGILGIRPGRGAGNIVYILCTTMLV